MANKKEQEPNLITRGGRDRTKDILIDEPSSSDRVAAAERSEMLRKWAERERD